MAKVARQLGESVPVELVLPVLPTEAGDRDNEEEEWEEVRKEDGEDENEEKEVKEREVKKRNASGLSDEEVNKVRFDFSWFRVDLGWF